MISTELNSLFNIDGIKINKEYLYSSLLTQNILSDDKSNENNINRQVEMMMDFNVVLFIPTTEVKLSCLFLEITK